MASPVEVPPQVPVRGPSFIRQLAPFGIIGPPLFILFTIVEDILQKPSQMSIDSSGLYSLEQNRRFIA